MAVNLGINIQRSPNRINQQLREAGVIGKYPKLLLDFADNYYLANGGSKTLANAVTHARAGNATMTDGYGPELVTNGGFDSDSDWTDESASGASASIVDGIAVLSGNNSRLVQDITTEIGKTYFVDALSSGSQGTRRITAKDGSTTLLTIDFDDGDTIGAFTATSTTTEITLYGYGSGLGKFDHVSVREMPAIKWAPHNLVTYSEDYSSWSGNALVESETTTAPDGVGVATKITDNQAGSIRYIAKNTISVADTGTYTACAFIKKDQDETRFPAIILAFRNGTSVDYGVQLNTKTGAVNEINSGADSFGAESVGDYWKLSVTGTNNGTGNTVVNFEIPAARGNSITTSNASATGSIFLWGAHLYRSDLGGMVDNPERGDSYVPTALRPFGANLVTNGTFDADISNWTNVSGGVASYESGVMRLTPAGGDTLGGAEQTITTVSGKAYELTVTVTSASSATFRFGAGTTTNFLNLVDVGSLGVGTHTISFVAGGATTYIIVYAQSGGVGTEYVEVNNITVRESTVRPDTARYLPRVGHHVYNGSAWVNEGVLAESESRVNLITYSTPDSNWTPSRVTITENNAVSPDGTENATRINETTATNSHFISANATNVTSGLNYTLSAYVKADTSTACQLLFSSTGFGSSHYANFDLSTGTVGYEAANATATIQDVGNGWYRCAITSTATATTSSTVGFVVFVDNNASSSSRIPSYAGDTAQQMYVYGAQFESGSTPSSLIPTSGSSVTREAESFTIPSANLPWPTPQYIGSELVTNGTFDTDSDWTKGTGWTISGGVASCDGSQSSSSALQAVDILTIGTTYEITFTVVSRSAGSITARLGTNGVGTTRTATGTYKEVITCAGTDDVRMTASNDFVGSIDNISVREINPLSVSIGMEGRVTYANTWTSGTQQVARFFDWRIDNDNKLLLKADLTDAAGERLTATHEVNNVADFATFNNFVYEGVLQSVNVALRVGSTFCQVAADGQTGAENATLTSLVDLSATDLDLVDDYMGTVSEFRVWDKDLGDDGIVEATNPSLEPSLSLTFEGVGTNSFVTNDWSQ